MRRLHRAHEWQTGQLMSRARRGGGWVPYYHRRGALRWRNAPSGPTSIYRRRCVSVRLLHFGANHFGCCMHRGRSYRLECGNPRMDERQYLPLFRLSANRGGGRRCREGEKLMRNFSYTQAASRADAIALAALPDTMILAGGTELLNWNRIGIAEPARIVDI